MDNNPQNIFRFENRKQHYFEEIVIPDEPSCLVIIDIDGTLAPDTPGDIAVENAVKEKVVELSNRHRVYLCSNGKDRDRAQGIASMLGIELIDSKYKKYSRKILKDIRLDPNRRTLVIGDKILTDGLLALRLHAHFYLIKRKHSGKERLLVRLMEFLDDAIVAVISL
ncbi:MAG: hypothetical protein Q8P21_02625 [bacterium]|nr:hypothetical protein [bacterium]